MNQSATLRAMLAQEGIFLDEKRATAPPPAQPTAAPVDREAIRAVLLERGAPLRDLDWLVASCPSMELAQAFEPTPWMLRDFADYVDDMAGTGPAGKGRL